MSDSKQISAGTPAETMDTQTARQVEREKLTRRAALRKLGFGAGLAAFSLLGVDDFARMVGQRMQRMAGDNKVAQAVAKEFQESGVAFAAFSNPSGTICQSDYDRSGCSSTTVGKCCLGTKGNQLDCCYKSGNKATCCAAISNNAASDAGTAQQMFNTCMIHVAGGFF